MARRKRIPYDPPNQRKRRRRDSGQGSATYISRRMFVAKAGVVAAFTVLAGKLGVMQVRQREVFQKQAEENIMFVEPLVAPRGLIVDRKGRSLAENRRAWEVRVVPAELPDAEDDPVGYRRVLDTLASALGLADVLVVDKRAVPEGSADTVYGRVARMLYGEGNPDIPAVVADWQERAADNELLKITTLTIDDAAIFRSRLAELPGVRVINEVEYLVENIWARERPITIATDVRRDVALGLEANLMYLPGVHLDGNALVRSYKGGEVMSHVMGYVQSIDTVDLKSPQNLDSNKQPIYDQTDMIGKEGLERALESVLRGKKGSQQVERDVNGVEVRTIAEGTFEPTPGENVRLTIDLELQNAVGEALRKGIEAAAKKKEEINAERREEGRRKRNAPDEESLWAIPNAGAVVAYDPRNGEVLAMVSYPYYDNQLFATGISDIKFKEYTDRSQGAPFLNRCVNEQYPPGSTFKIYLAASALSQGTLTVDETHSCTGGIFVPYSSDITNGLPMACWVGWNRTLQDSHRGGLDLYGAIAQSCDTYFYNVAVSRTTEEGSGIESYYYDFNLLSEKIDNDTEHVFEGLGIDPLADDMKNRFWFGKATEVEINEVGGLFPDREWKSEVLPAEAWNVGDTLNVSIGQGEVKATPLQIAMNTGMLANGGIAWKPRLVHSTFTDEKETASKAEQLGKLGIEKKHLDIVVEGMRRVVHTEQGTAFRTKQPDETFKSKWLLTNPEGEEEITIAGKTGTAEFGDQDDLGARDTHAWFTCFAPLEAPEIAVAVVIEAGGEGSSFAVPVADEVLRAYFELTGKRPRGKVLETTPLAAPGDPPVPESTPGASPEASPDASPQGESDNP
jgi:penicillin-binding protein 2